MGIVAQVSSRPPRAFLMRARAATRSLSRLSPAGLTGSRQHNARYTSRRRSACGLRASYGANPGRLGRPTPINRSRGDRHRGVHLRTRRFQQCQPDGRQQEWRSVLFDEGAGRLSGSTKEVFCKSADTIDRSRAHTFDRHCIGLPRPHTSRNRTPFCRRCILRQQWHHSALLSRRRQLDHRPVREPLSPTPVHLR